MTKYLKRYKTELIIFFAIIALYFFSRLSNIMSLPLFTDEAIYVRWSQIARFDAAWRFISLTDGKQPSFVWMAMNIMRVVDDPLLASRLVSVISGLFSIAGLFFLGREVFKSRWAGILSSFLYLIFPMSLVYDRMALYDSLVGSFAIWGLYLEILLIRRIRLDIALITGMVIGGAVLTKTNAFFNLYLMPATLILFDWKAKKRSALFFKFIGLALLTLIIANAFYSVLRLSPFFHIINDKNSVFVYPLKEWLEHPLRFWQGNLSGLWDWYITYTTIPVFILTAGSFFISFKFFKEKILLFIWFIVPLVALAVFGKVLYPRFIFFMTLSLLPLAAFSILRIFERIKNVYFSLIILFIFSFLMIRSDYFIVKDFARAPIPGSDLEQYINGWPAGGGVKEIINFLGEESASRKIYVATEGTFGSLPTYAVEIYLGDNRNVDKGGIWPLPKKIPKDLIQKSKKMPVYIVFNNSQIPPDGWALKFIAKYQKGIGNSYMSLYQVMDK